MIIERNANVFDKSIFRDIQMKTRLYFHLIVVLCIRLEQKVILKTDGFIFIFIEDNLFQT